MAGVFHLDRIAGNSLGVGPVNSWLAESTASRLPLLLLGTLHPTQSQRPGCTSKARKLGGVNLLRGRGVPARRRKANNERKRLPIVTDSISFRREEWTRPGV